MSRLSANELALLSAVADELREVFAERGHRIDVALAADRSFKSGWSRAALTRDLVIDASKQAASRFGLDFRSVTGGGWEFRTISETTERRFRLRRGHHAASGELEVTTSSDSALASGEESLLRQEQWVLAWVSGGDDAVGEVFAAEVTGYVEGNPGRLLFGDVVALGGVSAPHAGFVPADEELEGFELLDDLDFGPSA